MDQTPDLAIDLVIDNANVITVDPTRPRATSIAIAGSRIVGVGGRGAFAEVAASSGARVVDLDGRTVVPGFNDAHNHMQAFGATLNEVALNPNGVHSVEEIVAAISERAAETSPGVWVIGTGYDDNKLAERRHPTRQELDRGQPGQSGAAEPHLGPLLRREHRGHAPGPHRRGRRARGWGGRHSATTVSRTACWKNRPRPWPEHSSIPGRWPTWSQNLAAASDLSTSPRASRRARRPGSAASSGLEEPLELRAYQRARRDGQLGVRVTLMPSVETLHGGSHHPDDDEPFALDLGMHTGFGDDWLQVRRRPRSSPTVR